MLTGTQGASTEKDTIRSLEADVDGAIIRGLWTDGFGKALKLHIRA